MYLKLAIQEFEKIYHNLLKKINSTNQLNKKGN